MYILKKSQKSMKSQIDSSLPSSSASAALLQNQDRRNSSEVTWEEELAKAVESRQQKSTIPLIVSVFTAILGSFQFGYTIGVPNTPENTIRKCEDPGDYWLPKCISMNSSEWALVVALFAIGGLFGGLSGGLLCKRFGRKSTLLYNNIFFLIGAIMMGFAIDITTMAVGRIILGIGCGVATAAVPMYIAEISPVRLRGTLGTFHQLAIVIGILVAQILGIFMSTLSLWRYLMAGNILPSIMQIFLIIFFMKESPRYLISCRKRDRALKALQYIRNTEDVSDELDLLIMMRDKDCNNNEAAQSIRLSHFFTIKHLREAMVIAILAQLGQQLCGINGVIQYSTGIFEGIFGDNAKYVTLGIGFINFISTIVSAFLMDLAGRRVLLLSSQTGVVLLSVLITFASIYSWNIVNAIATIAFVAMFAVGLGPIPWLIMAEIFPTHAVATASSISVMINWTSSAFVTWVFKIAADNLGVFKFLPFAGAEALVGIVLFFLLPETKGKSIEDIIEILE